MSTQNKEIIECLKHLIETQDFIIIPDFGALVMQMESAEFSASQNVLFPPRKKILFNPLLKHNDGLLISELQKSLDVEYALAQTLVQQFVQSIKILLDTRQRADIEDIGFFYKDINGNILFESVLNPFYLSESLGLYPVRAIAVEKEYQSISNNKEVSKGKVIRFEPKNLYKAAVVLLIVSLLFVYWWISPFDFKNNLANLMGRKPVNVIKVSDIHYPIFKPDYNILNDKKSEIKPLELNKQSEIKTEISQRAVYSIVAGCFKMEQNAKKLFNEFKNKGIEASIKWNEQKQMFVISVGNFNNKTDASAAMNKLKMSGVLKDAWIKEEK